MRIFMFVKRKSEIIFTIFAFIFILQMLISSVRRGVFPKYTVFSATAPPSLRRYIHILNEYSLSYSDTASADGIIAHRPVSCRVYHTSTASAIVIMSKLL